MGHRVKGDSGVHRGNRDPRRGTGRYMRSQREIAGGKKGHRGRTGGGQGSKEGRKRGRESSAENEGDTAANKRGARRHSEDDGTTAGTTDSRRQPRRKRDGGNQETTERGWRRTLSQNSRH